MSLAESREPPMFSPEREIYSRDMKLAQRRLFRKLLHVLAEIIDERGHFATNDDALREVLNRTDSEAERDDGKNGMARDTPGTLSQIPSDPVAKGSGGRKVLDEAKSVLRFRKLCENHGQVTYHIRGSLNALGGGGRTAEALRKMHTTVDCVKDSFDVNNDLKTVRLDPIVCAKQLDHCKKATSEVREAFRELGIFNAKFFDTLQAIMKHLEIISWKLDAEYGTYGKCHVDRYLDSLFEPLTRDFGAFLDGLTNIADKEIVAIRLAQDFASQRYLNLTTVATFLSSVTATTLQITSDPERSNSALGSVTNTVWLVSLVFSTASAVYSLLMMTWRQSSVNPPNLSLPSFLNAWIQNGPMNALITALLAFSIGICLLGFHVVSRQGALVPAAVPTTFAGIHAHGILLLSVWFLVEKWKANHAASWTKLKDGYIIPFMEAPEKSIRKIKKRWHRVDRKVKDFLFRVKHFTSARRQNVQDNLPRPQLPRLSAANVTDIETGHPVTPPPDSAATDSKEAFGPVVYPTLRRDGGQHRIPETIPEMSSSQSVQAITGRKQLSTVSESRTKTSDNLEGGKNKPFENLLEFSPDGTLLACAWNDTVAIYDVERQFSVHSTVKTLNGDEVKQITWNQYTFHDTDPARTLAVRSLEAVSIWKIRKSGTPEIEPMGHLRQAVTFVQWTTMEDAVATGFICASDTTVKLFNENVQEIRSFDLSKSCQVDCVIYATFFLNRYLVCLATVPYETRCDFLVAVDLRQDSVQTTALMYRGHTSITVSSPSKRILVHGSDHGVEMVQLSISESRMGFENEDSLWMQTHNGQTLHCPEEAVTFHGHDDKTIVGYSAGEIVVLYCKPSDGLLSTLHNFTTLTPGAIPDHPVSFAVNPGSSSKPYMFAFGDRSGSITIWSVQSNDRLLSDKSVPVAFELHDRRGSLRKEATISTGRFLVLPSPSP